MRIFKKLAWASCRTTQVSVERKRMFVYQEDIFQGMELADKKKLGVVQMQSVYEEQDKILPWRAALITLMFADSKLTHLENHC